MSSIPTQMKAATISGYGPILETVKVITLPVPQPKEDEVLIRIHFASINPLDNLITLGAMQAVFPVQFPYILGYDISGVVVSVGSKATKFKVGDEVFSRIQQGHGALAEYVAENENVLSLKPSNLSFAEAAALPLCALTAYQTIEHALQLKKGEKVFITAGAGGVGLYAAQIANNVYGAFVSTTASQPKHAIIASLLQGQFNLIDYKNQDFTKTLCEYDAVFDMTAEVLKEFPIVKRGGKVVSIGQYPPTRQSVEAFGLPEPVLQGLAAANAHILAAAEQYGVSYAFYGMHSSGSDLDQIAKWTQEGKLKTVIDKTFTLDDAAQALNYLKQATATGKVLIQIA